MTVYDFSAKTITGEEKSLKDYKGKALLIVNVVANVVSHHNIKDYKRYMINIKTKDSKYSDFLVTNSGTRTRYRSGHY